MTPDQSVSVREFLERLMEERDRRYEERDRANKLIAEKTADALNEYKINANEWRATLNDIVSRMMPRQEFEREHKLLEKMIEDLRESRSITIGKDEAIEQSRKNFRWIIGIGVSLFIAIAGAVLTIITTR